MTSFSEKYDSRKVITAPNGDAQSAEFVYTLTGVADENSARILATNSTASTYGDLIRKSITLEPVHVDTTDLAACIWEVTVQYGEQTEPEEGESSFSFDTGGGTQHITQSLGTVGSYAASGTAPDFKGAIGVTHDNVEGQRPQTQVWTGHPLPKPSSGATIVGPNHQPEWRNWQTRGIQNPVMAT